MLLGGIKIVKLIFIMLMTVCAPLFAFSQEKANVQPMLSVETTKKPVTNKVTAVYGVTADDYLPTLESARRNLRPNIRRPSSHPSFDLPDAFYFIGGPIFLLILLRVLVIFLNGFEETRKEEQRTVASEKTNPE